MTQVIICVGLPNSGKSTFYSKHYPTHIRLSTDDYIEWVAEKVNSTYNEVFTSQINQAGSVLNSIRDYALSKELPLYWDQTNLTAKTRKSKLRSIPESYERIAVFFNTPFDVCMERNRAREGKVIPQRVMLQMKESLIPPTIEEGFSKIIII
jgi:predicted kinase